MLNYYSVMVSFGDHLTSLEPHQIENIPQTRDDPAHQRPF